ncbi:MAG TPA: FtsX-like permease family protein [Candidatus Flavonifractor merdavium]|nr:FtsX-like permease family protein [Candidatus Flavonifractor merdavium]
MFSKLAWKNVRRSVKDYGVWFLTIAFGVCLFYVFNALENQSVLRFLAQNPKVNVVEAIQRLIGILSAFVWAVLAFLILYASGFLIRRRKSELGTYLLLGMERWQVARLLLVETVCIGVLALAAGLALGVLAAWGLSAFTATLFAVPMTFFTFELSLPALAKTALAFAAIFLLVMVYHAFAVSRCRLIDLMRANRVNQTLRQRSLGASVALFLVGVVLLVIAYAMLLTRGLLRVDALFWVMIGLGSLGTLLFFRSLSGFLLRICQSSKGLYYKNLNLFVLRQFNARINTTYRSMTVICLMLLLALGITASSVGLNNTVEQMTNEMTPRDMQLIFWNEPEDPEPDLAAVLKEGGFDPETECSAWLSFPVYQGERSNVLSQADYDAMVQRWGKKEADAFLEREWVEVAADETAQTAPLNYWYFLADYAGDKNAAEEKFEEAVSGLAQLGGFSWSSKLQNWLDMMGTKVLVLFIGLYLGVLFLLASAAVLALQQLTQAADSAGQYRTLSLLGAPAAMRGRAVTAQVFLAFFLPLSLALVHAAVGMTAANAVIAEVGKVDAASSSAVTALLLLVVYGGYFLATCWGSRRILRTSR